MEVLSPEPSTPKLQAGTRRPRSSGLREQKRTAEDMRAELESYMDHVRTVATLGDDFEEKVSFALKSDQAAQALVEQDKMDEKLAAGKKKIAKLDEKLLALEKRAAEAEGMSDDEDDEEDDVSRSKVVPGAFELHFESSLAVQDIPASNRNNNDYAESDDYVTRNIQLARTSSRLMTPHDEARVEELLLLADYDDDHDHKEEKVDLFEEGKSASTRDFAQDLEEQDDGEKAHFGTLARYGELPDAKMQSESIRSRLRLLVGPTEWETKSFFLTEDDEPPADQADDCRASVRSDSALSRVADSQKEAKQRLKEIDEALQYAAQTDADMALQVQCDLHVLLSDAERSVQEHGLASKDAITKLLCTLGVRSPTFALSNSPAPVDTDS
ncbi:Hypothetical Protein FCC1311_093902 [Hondaea fermentalgiana]|uniref:Fibrous sheath-interacting protein 1 n=1 Tax=Hondaea fermentalgiana TaxID=2315210 RepID=A0A2R5GQK5_9STRA|nr:Hypothetical Protein FCC1311_093902 [Hondaea fermentalgiana]|eukprot:GBG33166.1 Hypothetical Protein FCC1311_093902 [Hondaea fermentalgiana]